MRSDVLAAAAAISITGPYALQGLGSARGLQVWADLDDIDLRLVDDEGSPAVAVDAYRNWISQEIDLLLGPYGSGQTRHVYPQVTQAGWLLWNHGGAADDLARRGVVSVAAPASTYFHGAVELAHRMGLQEVIIAAGTGGFASAVVSGALERANGLGIAVRVVPCGEWAATGSLTAFAVLVAGTFTEDLTVVARMKAEQEPALLGCVAAGLREFGSRLGGAADLVVGPVQWIPQPACPEIGPSGADFARHYEARFGEPADYVAAQAAAAGFLAAEAARRGYQHTQIRRWRTSTLLGSFALDEAWRQVGHAVTTIRWRHGRRVVAL